jgi:CRP/FNR family transcriptional regulator, dissimilatory nitrate respiration regulator
LRRLNERGDLALKMLAALSRHLRCLVVQVEQLTIRSATERVAGFLLRLCPHANGSAVIDLPLDKVLIAGRLGMQPETLSRSLAKLRAHGVATKGGIVTVGDIAALRRLSARGPGR